MRGDNGIAGSNFAVIGVSDVSNVTVEVLFYLENLLAMPTEIMR